VREPRNIIVSGVLPVSDLNFRQHNGQFRMLPAWDS
jgi:hypothetical protein